MAPTPSLEVTLIDGVPYVECGQCNGTGDEGIPPFCAGCFGSGLAPLGSTAIRAARLGEDLDVHVRAYREHGSGGGTGTVDKTNKFASKCIKCGGSVAAGAGWLARDGQKWAAQHRIGECIVKVEAAVRSNKFAGECGRCHTRVKAGAGTLTGSKGSWGVEHIECPEVLTEVIVQSSGIDLSGIPAGRYAVPGGDTRLKIEIDKPDNGTWAGWIFVRDAAEYGHGTRYGKQAPGKVYQGAVQAELLAILADPFEASKAYGRLVSRCGVCNRALEDEESVAAGIGPICARRFR